MAVPTVTKPLVALGIAVLLLASLHQLNAAVMALAIGAGRSAISPLLFAAGLVLGAALAWFASTRAGRAPTPRLLAAAVLGLVAVGYAAFLAFVPAHRFGGAATGSPFEVIEENYPRRGTHTYRLNGLGFRGPEWDDPKPAGTIRGVVIGDSMVFGSGVDDADTLDAALARRLRERHAGAAVEVLNLGVQGSNLPGYVALYRAASEQLAPDFVVLCLFLPNDLGGLEQPAAIDRLGAFSFFAFLLGTNNNPYTLYALRAADARPDAAKLAFLADHARAVEEIRRARPGVPLFVFLYRTDDARWTETLRAELGEGSHLVEHAPFPETDFIPDDGHPTAEGNRRFAEILADAVTAAGVVR